MIVRGDARHLPLADNSVDLVVTSPPYFNLRSYTDAGQHYAGQIGAEPTPAEYIDNLIACTQEWMRALKPSGSIFVNLGDKYGPNKSLLHLPERYRIAAVDQLGLISRAVVIWSKPNGLPESVTDRVRRSHEDWVHLVRSPRYYSAVDTIRTPHDPASQAHVRRYAGRDYGKTNAARGDLGASNFVGNPLGALPGSVWTIPTQPLKVPAELGIDHFAAFPCELPRRIIQGWSPSGVCTGCGEGRRPTAATTLTKDRGGRREQRAADAVRGGTQIFAATTLGRERSVTITGESCACPDTSAPTCPAVVLDPFGGTGTVKLVAEALGRRGISVDMSADYCRLATWRVNDPGQIAAAMQVEKPRVELDGQGDLFSLADGAA